MSRNDSIKQVCFRSGFKGVVAEAYTEKTSVYPPSPIRQPFYSIFSDGTVIAHPGYAWDFDSGPARDSRKSKRASLVHDVLCQAIKEGLLDPGWRDQADAEYYRLLREDKMFILRALWRFGAIQTGGKAFARFGDPHKLQYAP
jgi:hypothetical protein